MLQCGAFQQHFVIVNCLFILHCVCNSIDGVVVCEEFEQVLLEAWQEEEEQAEKRKAEVRSCNFTAESKWSQHTTLPAKYRSGIPLT